MVHHGRRSWAANALGLALAIGGGGLAEAGQISSVDPPAVFNEGFFFSDNNVAEVESTGSVSNYIRFSVDITSESSGGTVSAPINVTNSGGTAVYIVIVNYLAGADVRGDLWERAVLSISGDELPDGLAFRYTQANVMPQIASVAADSHLPREIGWEFDLNDHPGLLVTNTAVFLIDIPNATDAGGYQFDLELSSTLAPEPGAAAAFVGLAGALALRRRGQRFSNHG